MKRLSLSLLGGFQARLDSGAAVGLPTRKAQALLAYLALPPGRSHPRDKLAALLWGGIREGSARASLRQALFAIRKALDDRPALTMEGSAVALMPDAADVDTEQFTRAVASGDPEALARAADLYRGDLLAGLVVDEPPFEEWLLGERERLRELAVEALAKLLAHQRRAGVSEAATQTALKLLTLDPLQEPVHRALMRLYADLGRRGAALRQYQQCVSVLQRELGTEPDAETKTLYETILRARGTRATPGTADRQPAVSAEPARALRTVLPSARRSSEFVGRATEMATLVTALDRAVAGQGNVVAILAEAGAGKSRIASELATAATARHVSVLTGRAYESEQILAFGPWVAALRAARMAADTRLVERLEPAWRAELSRLLPELGDPPSTTVDARRLFDAVAAALGHLAALQPLLFVLEDLHWADEMTARLLGFVGRRLAEWPLLVVVTARAEEIADAPALAAALDELDRDGRLTRVPLGPLSRDDTHALTRCLARTGSDEAALARLADHAWAVSEGNPFVVVEAVLASSEGAQAGSHAPRVPDRVRDIVGRRLSRLSERGRALAAAAAVVGRACDFALLHRASGLDDAAAAGGVEELVRRGILHGVGEAFDFTHDRIRETAYGALLGPRRQLLHRRVAEAIEDLVQKLSGPQLLALGLHYREAGVWAKAVDYLTRAGRDAQTIRSANREAAACYDAALAALAHVHEDETRAKTAIELLIYSETALMGFGDFQTALARLREAETLARGVTEPRYLGRVRSRLTYQLGSIGDLQGAVAAGEEAIVLMADEPNVRLRSGVHVVVARAHYALGDFRRAIEIADRNEALRARERDPQLRERLHGFSSGWAILAEAELGEFASARARGEFTIRTATLEAGPHGKVWGHLCVGRMLVVHGDAPAAIETLTASLPLCDEGSDLQVYFSRTASSLGLAHAMSGRVAEGVALLERAAAHAEAIGFAYGHALVVGMLGEARLIAGDVDEAGRRAEEALALARKYGQRGSEAWALRLAGEHALARRAADAAGARFAEATALATARGMRPLLAHCRMGVGQACALRDDRVRARATIDGALSEYRAMAMPYWTARAEKLARSLA
jgi:DNA-binding SARP family transcriptional activator